MRLSRLVWLALGVVISMQGCPATGCLKDFNIMSVPREALPFGATFVDGVPVELEAASLQRRNVVTSGGLDECSTVIERSLALALLGEAVGELGVALESASTIRLTGLELFTVRDLQGVDLTPGGTYLWEGVKARSLVIESDRTHHVDLSTTSPQLVAEVDAEQVARYVAKGSDVFVGYRLVRVEDTSVVETVSLSLSAHRSRIIQLGDEVRLRFFRFDPGDLVRDDENPGEIPDQFRLRRGQNNGRTILVHNPERVRLPTAAELSRQRKREPRLDVRPWVVSCQLMQHFRPGGQEDYAFLIPTREQYREGDYPIKSIVDNEGVVATELRIRDLDWLRTIPDQTALQPIAGEFAIVERRIRLSTDKRGGGRGAFAEM